MTQASKSAIRNYAGIARKTVSWTIVTALKTWRRRMRDRRALSNLDAHMLRDIGLDQMTVDREIRRRFWQE
ncbi:MAG: DUF1127 domain-containing protein [Albidovulum sp.]|jgi:uncharacterized protein YjiS (DUF1127 family)